MLYKNFRGKYKKREKKIETSARVILFLKWLNYIRIIYSASQHLSGKIISTEETPGLFNQKKSLIQTCHMYRVEQEFKCSKGLMPVLYPESE